MENKNEEHSDIYFLGKVKELEQKNKKLNEQSRKVLKLTNNWNEKTKKLVVKIKEIRNGDKELMDLEEF